MVRVDQTVAIFSGAYNNVKLLNWKQILMVSVQSIIV